MTPRAPLGRRFGGGLAVVALLAVYAASINADYAMNDVDSSSVAAWRIATTGAPWLEGIDTEAIAIRDPERLWLGETSDGHTVVYRSPGSIAPAVPAYLVARLFGVTAAPESFSLVPAALTAALLVALAMALLFGALDGLVSTAAQRLSVGALGLGTPVWSVAADGMHTHSVTAFGLAGMAWAARRERWWLLGLFGGIGLWGRLHVAVIVALVGLGLALWRRRPSVAVQVGVPSMALMGLASLWSRWIYDSWWPSGGYGSVEQYAARASHSPLLDSVVNVLGLLVAPDRGLLAWTPVLLLLLPAVLRGWREAPDWTRCLAVAGLVYLLIQGNMNVFHGGSGFWGYRLTLETLVCLFPVYAVTAHHVGRVARALVGPLLGLQVGVLALGASLDQLVRIPEWAWTWHSGLGLALRHPALAGTFFALTTLIGALAARVWLDRGLRWTEPGVEAAGLPDLDQRAELADRH